MAFEAKSNRERGGLNISRGPKLGLIIVKVGPDYYSSAALRVLEGSIHIFLFISTTTITHQLESFINRQQWRVSVYRTNSTTDRRKMTRGTIVASFSNTESSSCALNSSISRISKMTKFTRSPISRIAMKSMNSSLDSVRFRRRSRIMSAPK